MTASNMELSITITLQWEGGYGNDPQDPGGPTNWGITIFDARKYWRPAATAADVRAMPKSVAIDIYKQKYWKTDYYNCDTLADGVDLMVFDYGVNSGPSRAYAALIASVGGPASDTINRIYAYRMNFLRRLGTWSHFGSGWTSRVNGVHAAALRMAAAAAAAPKPIPTPVPTPRPVPVPTPTVPPVTTPVPVPVAPQLDIGALITSLGPLLLPLIPTVMGIFPLTAPFVPLVQAGLGAVTKAQPTGGVAATPPATMQDLVATGMYEVAIMLKPSLPHTT